MEISVILNGEARRVSAARTVADLLRDVARRPELVVVQLNGEIPDRARYAEIALQEGDRVELVQLVGGG